MIATLGQKAWHHCCAVRVAMHAAGKAALPRLEIGNIGMATAGQVPSAAGFVESRMTQSSASCRPALRPLPALARKLMALSVLSCAMTLAACASKSPEPGYEANQIHATADRQPELRIHRPARALLTPQPAPDCEFKGSDLKPVDPDRWERLKVDYERQCYQRAEQAVRKRLRLLQASNQCEIEPVLHSSPTGR